MNIPFADLKSILEMYYKAAAGVDRGEGQRAFFLIDLVYRWVRYVERSDMPYYWWLFCQNIFTVNCL
jgi:hypothetical protein